ncbi:MAG: biotin/lipoyl-binding protein [Chloroflexi bacterium]|nr:biotin/lipoyl-binding protein [Chloroflexota bacterium]
MNAPPRPQKFRLKVGDRWFDVEVHRGPGQQLQVLVDGQPVEVQVEGQGAKPQVSPGTAGSPVRAPAPPAEREIRSPMPGRVVAVSVRPGARVNSGDEVCVLEAMKMEQSIRVASAGTVKAVHIEPGQNVSAGDLLVEIE